MKYEVVKAKLAKGKRPGGMGYGDYAKMCKAEDDEPMSQEDYEDMDEDDDDDDEDDEARKGLLDFDELRKALEGYEAVEDVVLAHGSRQEFLEARQASGQITKSERRELGRIWAGEAPAETGTAMRKSLVEHIDDIDGDANGLIDGSEVLETLRSAIGTSLDEVAKSVSTDGRATRTVMKAQGDLIRAIAGQQMAIAKALAQRDAVIKSLVDRLGLVESTPAQPRAVTKNTPQRQRPLAKSVNGAGANGKLPPGVRGGLNAQQIAGGIRDLVKSAVDNNADPQTREKLLMAGAKFQASGEIDRDVLIAVENHVLGPAEAA